MNATSSLLEILDAMRDKRIVIYGDLVVDHFLYGTPKRVSREAPVLILRQEREDLIPGGGGNAVCNVHALGGTARPVGLVGEDRGGAALERRFSELGIDHSGISRITRWNTPTKMRILAGMPHAAKQQIVRFDHESPLELSESEIDSLRSRLERELAHADAVLISDYGYGTVRPELVSLITSAAEHRPVTLDSRYDLLRYPGLTAATPNEEEASQAAGRSLFGPDSDAVLNEVGTELRRRLGLPALLITRGSLGMALFEEDRDPVLIPVHGSRQAVDVTGAGDTVIATFTLALAAGASFSEAAELANYAGSVVVMKTGTATVTHEELASLLRNR